jgi:hypothetical protein
MKYTIGSVWNIVRPRSYPYSWISLVLVLIEIFGLKIRVHQRAEQESKSHNEYTDQRKYAFSLSELDWKLELVAPIRDSRFRGGNLDDCESRTVSSFVSLINFPAHTGLCTSVRETICSITFWD